MAQSFVSTYRDHYRWHHPHRRAPIIPNDDIVTVIPPEDIWIKDESQQEEMDPLADKQIKKWLRKRMWSAYQIYFCKDMVSKESNGEEVNKVFENELLEYCRNLYEPKTLPKIAPPLPKNRKLFGYLRPKRMYTPLSVYQHEYGRTAYNILKGNSETNVEIVTSSGDKKIQGYDNAAGKKGKPSPACNCRCCWL